MHRRLALPLLLALFAPGCFWRIWTNARDNRIREAASDVLRCHPDDISLDDRDDGYRAFGCGRMAKCNEHNGPWVCRPIEQVGAPY